MKVRNFDVFLESDLLLTQRSASEGAHTTLEYIPGSCFLGIVASKLYQNQSQFSADDLFTLFHSNKVRFLDARPVSKVDNTTGFVAPLSFYKPKKEQAFENIDPKSRVQKLDTQVVKNCSLSDKPLDEDLQLKQLRNVWITRFGHKINLEKSRVFKVSRHLEDHQQRALEAREGSKDKVQGQLFSYEGLLAGQILRCEIHADDSVGEALLDELSSVLTKQSVRVGRSRSAEFGWIRLKEVQPEQELGGSQVEVSGTVLFHLLSDMALRDPECGYPTFQPRPQHFGLGTDWAFKPERTFLRTRRYSPFNGHRRRNDLERQVLTAGSVICFVQEVPKTCLIDVSAGIGDYRKDGLGQVAVNSCYLTEVNEHQGPVFEVCKRYTKSSDSDSKSSQSLIKNTPLYRWIQRRQQTRQDEVDAYQIALKWRNELYAWRPEKGGPSKAQWGTVRQQAAVIRSDATELYKSLFAEKGLLRRGVAQKAWDKSIRGESTLSKLDGLVTNQMKAKALLMPKVLEMTAGLIVRLKEEQTSKKKTGGADEPK